MWPCSLSDDILWIRYLPPGGDLREESVMADKLIDMDDALLGSILDTILTGSLEEDDPA